MPADPPTDVPTAPDVPGRPGAAAGLTRRQWACGLCLAPVLGWAPTALGAPGAATAPGGPAPKPAPARAARPQQSPARPHKAPRSPATAAPPEAPLYAGHPALPAFAADAAERHGLSAAWIEAQLAQARRVDAVRRLIMPPPAGTAKNWAAYRARFIEPRRIAAGLAFWREHARWLDKAEAAWGVPPELVVAIVGVETFYGRHMGTFRVIDALATLSFDFPSGRRDRSGFFRDELAALFVLCQREGIAPDSLKGSFAGAMGLPQFMPSSVNRYAVDFDGDRHIDLHTNGADVVGSVAHYLAEFGWQRGMPTHFDVAAPVDTRDRAALLAPDILPSFSAAQMTALGAELSPAGRAHAGPLALVELQNGDAAPTFVAGTQNFYVVTRYNWSSYYAMAVIDLAAALRAGRG